MDSNLFLSLFLHNLQALTQQQQQQQQSLNQMMQHLLGFNKHPMYDKIVQMSFQLLETCWILLVNLFFTVSLLCFNLVIVLFHLPAHPYWGAFTCVGLIASCQILIRIMTMGIIKPTNFELIFTSFTMLIAVFMSFTVSLKVVISLFLFIVMFFVFMKNLYSLQSIITTILRLWLLVFLTLGFNTSFS